MNLGFRQIFTVLAVSLITIIVPAQEIPVLPGDPAVMYGVTPNGMSYYLVTNPDVKATADFALVQRTGRLTSDDSTGIRAVSSARDALASLRRIEPSSPMRFLASHEIAPGREGFVSVTDDATVFRFSDVRLNLGTDVVDSTLLVLMDVADRANYVDDDFIRKWYTPSDQAIVVSGDIDAKAIASKLRNMSYMIPAGESAERSEYAGGGNRAPVYLKSVQENPKFVGISAAWTSARVPREYMNTVQAEIFEMSLHTLGLASVDRIKTLLKAAKVPVADVSYSHMCSSSHPYDDLFAVRVIVEPENFSKALKTIAGVMSSIDAAGVDTAEYLTAESIYIQKLEDVADGAFKSNAEYVDRCVNSFLYNSSLASPKERLNFHTSRNLPDTMRQRLFNDIAKALLDGSVNLTVTSPEDPYIVKEAFEAVWASAASEPGLYMRKPSPDTLAAVAPGPKVKLKSSRKEHVSGGSVWTFANGFKVVYKKMDSERMYYNLALNGGYGSIGALEPGEGAFLSDYFRTCRIGDMKAEDFIDSLQVEGITMDMQVNMSNTMISGSLPYDRIPLLMRSLIAVTDGMAGDADEWEYYTESEYLALEYSQGSLYSRMTAIDSIMCPNYRYSSYKSKGKVSPDFRMKADAFFDVQFDKLNDGALILVGNVDEEKLKKLLTPYVGNFRTSHVAFRRPALRYQPGSGWITYTVDGSTDNIDVAISARLPLTMENLMAATLASMLLKQNLVKELEDTGMHMDMSAVFKLYPEERLNLMISVSKASEDGFSADLESKTPIEILADVRSALSGLHQLDIMENDLKPYKDMLKNKIAQEMKSPPYWIRAVSLRYLDGKDLSTGYASKIDAVTPERVMSVLNLLDAGCKVEYVTSGKDD